MANHPSLEILVARAFKLRCPRCGTGRMFTGWTRMHRNCLDCRFLFDRAPGYFLGSTYINYAFTAVILTVGYVYLRFGVGMQRDTLMWPLMLFCVIFPLIFFRFARALWLSLDCYFDRTVFESDVVPSQPKKESRPK